MPRLSGPGLCYSEREKVGVEHFWVWDKSEAHSLFHVAPLRVHEMMHDWPYETENGKCFKYMNEPNTQS